MKIPSKTSKRQNRCTPFGILAAAWLGVLGLCICASGVRVQAQDATPSTFARYVPERLDDFAWENDLIAFRVYGPALRANPEDSGIDCWLKRVPYPIIDKWYKGGDYHKDHGEGCDPYHVGTSRGCGGIALIMPDGSFKTSDTYVACRLLETLRQQTIFELDYRYEGTDITETKRITIDLGKRLFKVESRFLENGKPRVFDVAVGITTHDGAAAVRFDEKAGWMACWETLAENGELGTGAIVPGATFKEVKSAEKDASHVWAFTKTDARGVVTWQAGYGWSKAKDITSFDKWTAYLAGEIRRFDISQYGAVSDDSTINTRTIQSAIDACYAQGGGTLVVPKGTFLTGSIFLRPGVNLEIQEGGILKASPNLADYPITIRRIAGAIEPHRSAMINAEQCHGLRITGPGALDGNSRPLFAGGRDFQETYPQRVQYRYPQICFIKESDNVVVRGVTFRDSAFWNLHFYRCRDLLVESSSFVVPAQGKSPSSDGIDLDSCQDAIVRDCLFSVDDDCIALKGTRGPDATKDITSPPVRNIHVYDCTFERGHGGVTLGTEATQIRDVLIERCTNTGKMPMLRIKMRPDTPGQIYENILMRDITLGGDGMIANARLVHGTKVPSRAPGSSIRNITIENVRGTCGGFGNLSGNANTQVADITLRNIDVTLKNPQQIRPLADGVANLVFENVRVNGEFIREPTDSGYPRN